MKVPKHENCRQKKLKKKKLQRPSSQFWVVGQIQHLQKVKIRENNPVQHINFGLELRPRNQKNQKATIFKFELKGRKKRKKGYEHLSGTVEAMFNKSGDLILRNFHCWVVCAHQRALSSSFWNTTLQSLSPQRASTWFNANSNKITRFLDNINMKTFYIII